MSKQLVDDALVDTLLNQFCSYRVSERMKVNISRDAAFFFVDAEPNTKKSPSLVLSFGKLRPKGVFTISRLLQYVIDESQPYQFTVQGV